MKATKLRPFVPSGADYELAKAFFKDIGCETVYSDNGISILRLSELEFFLQNYNDQHFQNNYMLEVTVEDLDGWWTHIQSILESGKYPTVRAKEPTQYPWGRREIHLIDPAGVCWHFGA
ncbi:glyoxalase [Paenibacillus montanisoli]|uniref:Glyoxalase n=1 Tax=Paenibacillus montanisoli TaxID=2081970 RepID=A0A328U1B1_9BACL|nr:glyoxalase [Paenibacillus montanisoli]RAP73794.1 glyoxalase [Paenibacillus montanisoli]